jgi:hypothetical protein
MTELSCQLLFAPDVAGSLHLLGPIPSSRLEEPRSVFVWLPSSYEGNAETPYPVVYTIRSASARSRGARPTSSSSSES